MSKNKIILTFAIAFALTFTGVQSLATTTGVVNTETVKMRSEASTESKIVMLVSQDDKVEIIEKSGDWYKVKFDGNTGYIYAEYVTTDDDKTENTNSTQSTNTQDDTNTTQTENNNVNTNNNTEVQNTTENSEENIISINSQVLVVDDTEVKLVPLINSSVIGTVKANTAVTVVEYVNGWYCIISSDLEGWVRKEKLDSIKNAQPEQTESTTETENDSSEEETQTETTKYVSTEKVNIRKKASTDSDIIKSITKNTKVTVIGTEKGWSKVKVDGEEGYISSEYLSDSKVKEENTNSTKNTTSNTTNKTTDRSLETSRTEEIENTSNNGADVVSYSKTFLGTRYVLGGASPRAGFDCSGFTMYIYKKYGVSLAHSARAQATVGTKVEKSNLQPGDLVLFKGETGSSIGHVGIYIGANQFIHASNPSDGVKITSLSTSYYSSRYVTARRVL